MSRRSALTLALLAGVIAALAFAVMPRSGANQVAVNPLRVTSGSALATGFAVGDDRVVTVAHILGGELRVGAEKATVLRVDRRSDLALLSVPGVRAAGVKTAGVENGGHVRLARIRAGRTSVLAVDVRRAIVAHVRAPGASGAVRRPALELDAHVSAGDSGAPVLTESGALAGVIFAASRRRPDTAYAVDAAALGSLLRR